MSAQSSVSNMSSNATAPMDYNEHEKTYEFFLRSATTLTAACITIAVCLAIGAFKHSWGIGGFLMVLAVLSGFIGMFSKDIGAKPAIATLLLSLFGLLVL